MDRPFRGGVWACPVFMKVIKRPSDVVAGRVDREPAATRYPGSTMEEVIPLHLSTIKAGEEPEVSLGDYLLSYLKYHAKNATVPAQIDARDGSSLSFPELLQHSVRAAAGWRALGLRRGDTLAIYSRNRAEVFPAILGALFEAITVVLTVPHARKHELRHCLSNVAPTAMVSEAALLDNALSEAAAETIHVVIGATSACSPNVKRLEDVLSQGDALGLRPETYSAAAVPDSNEHVGVVLFSSGTSGLKKAVQQTDRALTILCHDVSAVWRPLPGERALITHPLSWGTGLTTAKMCVVAGSTAVFTDYVDDQTLLREITRYKVTSWMTAPSRLLLLARLVKDLRERQGRTVDLGSLLYLKCCGGPLRAEAQSFIQDTLGVPVLQTYGTLEVYQVASHPVTDYDNPNAVRTLGSAGKICPGVRMRLVDVNTSEDVEGPGVRGEIRVQTPFQMKGYINVPESPWDDKGFFMTGDVGFLDSDGELFVVDRIKELIIYDEHHVSPAEVENVLQAHPAVKEACVVGRKHPIVDELPTAFVVTQPGASVAAKELEDLVKGKLTDSRRLRGGVHFVDAIPKSLYGKMLRTALKMQCDSLPPVDDKNLL